MGPIAHAAAVAHAAGSSRGERSQLSAMGVTRQSLMSAFGRAINDVVISHRQRFEELARSAALREPEQVKDSFQISRSQDEPKERWVDGTPENSFYIYELSLLFPEARFVHIVRDPRAVVRSLVHFHSIGGAHFAADAACREWLLNVRDCYNAEIALGSERVLRVRYDELSEHGPAVIARILQFVGEPYVEECAATLGVRINASVIPDDATPGDIGPELRLEAEALAAAALDTTARFDPDFAAEERLEYRLAERSFGPGLSPSVRHILRQSMPRDAIVVVATGGDVSLLELEGRTGLHFPQDSSGAHVQTETLSDSQLVQSVEDLRGKGAEFLVIPGGQGNLLNTRTGFVEYLRQSFRQIAAEKGVVDVWSLAAAGPRPPQD